MLFVTGAAVGYVFGARAGRKRYEQIRAAAERISRTPAFRQQIEQVQDFAARKTAELPGVILRAIFGKSTRQGTTGA